MARRWRSPEGWQDGPDSISFVVVIEAYKSYCVVGVIYIIGPNKIAHEPCDIL
jgi:hypothetical protein